MLILFTYMAINMFLILILMMMLAAHSIFSRPHLGVCCGVSKAVFVPFPFVFNPTTWQLL